MPLEFTEYRYAPMRHGTAPQVPMGQEIETQSVAIGVASEQSAAFNERTELIVISKVDADCRIAIGVNPVADNAEPGMTRFLKSGNEYAFDVEPGDKIAVIQAAP